MYSANQDPQLQAELDRCLQGLSILQGAYAFHLVDSTNEVALQLEKNGQASGSVVMTAVQTHGRGRLKRSWLSKEGDIALSIMLRPPHLPADKALIALIPALAIVDGLATLGIAVRLKWPNDIIIPKRPEELSVPYFADFRKVGGILVENVFSNLDISASIIGIGLNIVAHEKRTEVVPHAASLADIALHVTREQCARAILQQFDRLLLDVLKQKNSEGLLRNYSAHCETLGRDVVVETSSGRLVGRAHALDKHGALIINEGEREHIISAGDVTFVTR